VIKRLFAFLVIFVTGLFLVAAEVRADLTITPKRVVFQQRDRSATVTLLNITDHPNTYRLSWEMMKATPDGKYKILPYNSDTDKDPHSLPNMVFFSPRQVTIGPHGYQTIRLSLRRPADLPFGEYRAHLLLTRLAQPSTAPEKPNPDGKTLSMELDVNLSFSIPVIVRQGEDKALKVSLSNPGLRLQGKGAVLDVNINREGGTFSAYGDINVYWQPPKGNETLIGSLNNVALYPEVKSRQVSVQISPQQNISAGNIRVVYIGKLEAAGVTWAEATFPIGK
jgi:fimbrial chaperone protein